MADRVWPIAYGRSRMADRVSLIADRPSLRHGAQRTSRHRIGPNSHRSRLNFRSGGLSTLVCNTRANDVCTDGPGDAYSLTADTGPYRCLRATCGSGVTQLGARDQRAVSPFHAAMSRSWEAGSLRKRWAPPPGGDGAHTRGDLLLRQRHVSGDLAQ